jgi:hypothetical protein
MMGNNRSHNAHNSRNSMDIGNSYILYMGHSNYQHMDSKAHTMQSTATAILKIIFS